ncbi:SRPBCC family protein [Cryptosporangium minutisporangium]|uniref:Polyketide cyclase n=2 Tax=Cryptosporangium minutisporangium TaxID=113569 RepID=A0ABP6SS29_9ACTN
MDYATSVTINAPPETVWGLTTDIEGWPRIASSVTAVRRLDDGALQVGSQADVEQPRLRPARWQVTALEPGRMFVWESTSGGVTSIGEHIVTPTGSGSRLDLRIRQSGRLAGLVAALYGRRIRRYLHLEAEGFRKAAEAAVGAD